MKLILKLLILFIFNHTLYSGDNFTNLKLKLNNTCKTEQFILRPKPNFKKADMLVIWYLPVIINPMLVIEDKKVFIGLTKEISIGIIPYGRVAFEYSYIFRNYNKNHLRFSYNYDIILSASDFVAFIATPGAGYFTDTKNNGWFLHGSIGALMGPGEPFVFIPYFRYRHTFISQKISSDINDISLGVGISFYY